MINYGEEEIEEGCEEEGEEGLDTQEEEII
jgi:hypothetical protein